MEEFIESRVLKNKETLSFEVIENVAFTLRKFHYMDKHDEIEHKSLFQARYVDNGEELLSLCQEKMAMPIYEEEEQELLATIKQWITPEEL